MIAALMAPIEMPATQSGSNPLLAKRLEGAGLIGTERAAALQHQHTLRALAGVVAGAGLEESIMTSDPVCTKAVAPWRQFAAASIWRGPRNASSQLGLSAVRTMQE